MSGALASSPDADLELSAAWSFSSSTTTACGSGSGGADMAAERAERSGMIMRKTTELREEEKKKEIEKPALLRL
jgi:hypothetical protein